ncbi:pro-neuregulin-1, membrane-bound isoform-like isoform X2 [Polyodon spathula]|uniref:pro-neuregulin-1, membrane-bound isoform-like isoform X2 n=1 Tax=Polyodon spathula TaxID=7913 RepID=UPI001B7DE358|nr:pro-neuregulin-1, membrane-bound isoform-like isoform X2 [Polyodon spathula]
MAEGADETSPGPPTPPCADAAATDSPLFASTAQENAPEVSAATEGVAEENRALGLAGLAATCCICMETAQVRSCLNSEKICILPILACLISLALCTAGLKWVFVDKIFEPHTHLDPNRIGQDPIIYADQTLGPTGEPQAVHTSVLPSHRTGQQTVQVKGDPSMAPDSVHNPTFNSPTSALTLLTTPANQRPLTTPNVKGPTTGHPLQTVETNIIKILKLPTTTASTLGTGHAIKCNDSEKNYCVNGGECFVLNTIPSKTKYLCRCPNEFTGDRCQNYVMASFYKHLGIEFMEAEELYQKRVLTITGICIALLVVGIMCVVAYCKTKKQRKKLHDRLRQSLRSERNNMNNLANGPHHPNPPTESVQLVIHASKNAISADHVTETETSFSTSQYSSTTRHATPVTQTSSHSWNNENTESMTSESRSELVTSSMGTNGQTSPVGYRGRLNGTGCARDLTTYLKNTRDSPESYKDSPHSERYVSAMTTPNRMSPVELQSPLSPSSEMSPPLSSLATSVPSMAISPLVEDERPLLLVTPPRVREKRNDNTNSSQQRNSAHYNHGLEAHSPPPSPLRIVEDDEYETTQEYEPAVQQPAKKVANGRRAKRTKPNGHIPHKLESDSDSSSESSSSESETEDERVGEDTPFLSIQNPMAAILESAPAFRLADGSRTNTTHRLSTQEDLQARLSSVIVNQDPIAV